MSGAAAAEPAAPVQAAPGPTAAELASWVVGVLTARGESVAVAESLTGGLVAGALTSVPGASVVFRGGIVAYATELKVALLGVPADLLARRGPVDPEVAAAMAAGVRARLGASYGLSTTGVAGPGPADGRPAGTVFVAIDGPAGRSGRGLELSGDRQEVRNETVRSVLSLLAGALREDAA